MSTRLWPVSDRGTHVALRKAKRVRRGPLTVSRAEATSSIGSALSRPKVAFAVGACGNAVGRNRARRRLRAVMAELGPGLGTHAWLVRCTPEAVTMAYRDVLALADSAVGSLNCAPSVDRPSR